MKIRLECEYCSITAFLGGVGPDAYGCLPPIRVDCPGCETPLGMIAVGWVEDARRPDREDEESA